MSEPRHRGRFSFQESIALVSLETKNVAPFQYFSVYLCKMGSMGRPDSQEESQPSGAEPSNVIILPALKVGAFAGERTSPKYLSKITLQEYYRAGHFARPVIIPRHSQEFVARHLIQLIGSAGFLVGGFAGLSRLTTPGLFALVSGFQWFALGSTFWGTCSHQALTSLLIPQPQFTFFIPL